MPSRKRSKIIGPLRNSCVTVCVLINCLSEVLHIFLLYQKAKIPLRLQFFVTSSKLPNEDCACLSQVSIVLPGDHHQRRIRQLKKHDSCIKASLSWNKMSCLPSLCGIPHIRNRCHASCTLELQETCHQHQS